MAEKRYRFRAGSRLPQAKATVVGVAIEAIRGSKESVTAAEVLAVAKSRSSPLHEMFAWDDTEAALQYRLAQARHLLRSLEIEIVQENGEVIGDGRAWVQLDIVEGERDGGYMPIEAALNDEDKRVRLIERALSEAEAWQRRHASLVELAAVFDSLRATAERIRRKRRKREPETLAVQV